MLDCHEYSVALSVLREEKTASGTVPSCVLHSGLLEGALQFLPCFGNCKVKHDGKFRLPVFSDV